MVITNKDNIYGRWIVGESVYTNKIQALLSASRESKPVYYNFFNDVWKNFDRSLLGKLPLKQLYKQRAQMLREKYDYLVLYYSGGSDSWTILNTFLENNIKLDCVYVRWPMKAESQYTPNTENRSAYNFMSEWDFVLKKDLEWLSQNHPEIKIEIADWIDVVDPRYFNDDIFNKQNHMYSAANLLRMQTFSKTEIDLLDKGKRVGEIWGVDKPILIEYEQNTLGLVFRDEIVCTGQAYPGNPDGPEFFYWSPEFPILAMEQAYQVFLFYKSNPPLRSIVSSTNWKKMLNNRIFFEHRHWFADYTQHLTRKVIYPDWDFNKFQAEKPKSITREDKDFWLYSNAELKPVVDRWRFYYKNQLDNIKNDYLWTGELGEKYGVRSFNTAPFFIGKYND